MVDETPYARNNMLPLSVSTAPIDFSYAVVRVRDMLPPACIAGRYGAGRECRGLLMPRDGRSHNAEDARTRGTIRTSGTSGPAPRANNASVPTTSNHPLTCAVAAIPSPV